MSADGFRTDQDGSYAVKKAGSTLDYGFLWGDWLKGDHIVSSTWDLGSGLNEVSNTFDDSSTAVLISAGSAGVSYLVTNTVTTAAGLIDSRSFRLIVEA